MTLITEGNKSFLQNVYPTIFTFTRIKDSAVKQTNKQKQEKKQQMNIEEFPSENRKPSSGIPKSAADPKMRPTHKRSSEKINSGM